MQTYNGETIAFDATRTPTGYYATLHSAKSFFDVQWSAIPCPNGTAEEPAGTRLIELDRQTDGSFNVKIYHSILYVVGESGLGGDPVTRCVFDAPLTYRGVIMNRRDAAAVDSAQVGRYPSDHDSFMVLTQNPHPCPVPDSARHTCMGGKWPMKPIIDMPMVDTDGDGISDEWEVGGIHDGTNWLDLKSMGADPEHKDLFVQMDAASGAKYWDESLVRIADYFASLRVTNPDGHRGINLHLDAGPNSYMNGDTTWGTRAAARPSSPGDVFTTASSLHAGEPACAAPDKTPLTNLMRSNLDPLRAKVFRYVAVSKWVVANHDCYSGMNWNIPSKAFVIGDWAEVGIASADTQVGLFLHEMGHSLGLFHAGGSDTPQYKPNYQSVMNYAYQENGIPMRDGSALFQYSSVDPTSTNSIDENRLADRTGLPAVGISGSLFNFACTGIPDSELHPIAPNTAADLRCDGHNNTPAPNDITASDGNNPTQLQTFNDVAHLHLPLEDGPATFGAGRSIAPEGRSLIKALHDYGVRIGDRSPPTVRLTLKKVGDKRRVVIKAHDDHGLGGAAVTVDSTTVSVGFGTSKKPKKDASVTVDIPATGDVSVVVTDMCDKSATATAK